MTIRLRRRGAEAFAEQIESFSMHRREQEKRTAPMFRSGYVPESDADAALTRTLEELRLQQEELRVAEEELRAQLAELARTGSHLEAERERYADLFERAPDGYVVTDRRGVIREANATFAQLLGTESRFVRGKPVAALVEGESAPVYDALAKLGDGAESVRVPLRFRSRAGASVACEAHLSSTARGKRVLWSVRPVSDAPPASAPGTDLERALRDKDELLLRERRGREELERANRAKDRFIAVLSHDLRAPLNAILGWTQLLRREVLDQAARNRAFETIERNARTQAKLIEELLDVSRMAADRVQLALSPLDLGALVQRVVEGALPKAAEAGLELCFQVENDLTVVCDRQRIEQVVTNLLANSLKYSPPGGTIDVSAKRDDHHACIVVRDTGKGIEPALLPHVFEMYTQERDYSAARLGLGLGLYIVKQLVELQDGTVEVQSAGPGAGATFTVRLPLHDEVAASPSEIALEPAVCLRDVRILVVDDEEDSRDLVAAILRRAGAEVASASSASSAVELFQAWAPDVLVSDLAMPGGDGCELVSRLRQRDPDLGSVVVSGFSSENDAQRALAAGFDAHMSKPVDAAELVSLVHEIARRRRD